MDIIFDTTRIAANRHRALRNNDPKASFLLDIAADELGERLAVVERTFEHAVELHGATGAAARAAKATGKIGSLTRVESEQAYATSDDAFIEAPLEMVPLEPQSANLVIAPLSLHLTNDTPGVFIQIRRALRPDGLFLAAIPGSGTLQELREVLLATEIEMTGGASPRVIPFADVRDVGRFRAAGHRCRDLYGPLRFHLSADARLARHGHDQSACRAQQQAFDARLLHARRRAIRGTLFRSGWPHPGHLLDHLCLGMGAA
jgi:SAM-dependent methyltransferase